MYKQRKIQRLTTTACLAAVAFLLMFFEIPVIPVVSYLKLDFSDVPVLLGTALYGPCTGITVAILKCLLHGLVRGFSPVELLGLAANLCTSILLLLPFRIVFRYLKCAMGRQLTIAGCTSTILMTVVMTAFNYFVLTPAYMEMFNWHPTLPIKQLMLMGVVPFNIIKGIVVNLVFAIIMLHLRRWIKSRQQ